MFALFVCVFLIFCTCNFPEKYESLELKEIIM